MWEQGKNRDGTDIADMRPYPYSGYRLITVAFSASPGGKSSRYGYAYCDSNRIEINPGMLTTKSSTFFARVAAHEMGHMLGAHHTGSEDSFENGDGISLMATCLGSDIVWEGTEYTTDDDAVLTYQHAIGTHTVSANYGFERNLAFWKASGAAPTWVTGGTSGGQHHMMVLPTSSADNVHQVVNLANASGMQIRPSLNYTTPGATSGAIRLQLFYRTVVYTPTSDSNSECSAIDYRDMNDRWEANIGSWQLARDQYLPLSDSWRLGAEATPWTVPEVNGGAVDVLVRVFSTAAVSTGYVHVHYDDLRIQQD